MKWTRAIPERDNCTGILISPQKFIAINPKKLVIADCGTVYYTDETGLPKTEKQSRIATVDLESFAITTVNYDKDFGNSQNGSEYTTYEYQRVATSHSGYDFYNESGSSCDSCNVFFQLSFELDY